MSGRWTTCGKCGEPISSSPSATKTRFTGQLAARGFEGVQRGEERRLGPFLIHGAAADEDFAEAGLVDDARLRTAARTTPTGSACFTSYMK